MSSSARFLKAYGAGGVPDATAFCYHEQCLGEIFRRDPQGAPFPPMEMRVISCVLRALMRAATR
jgi:hypothetical protein